MFPATLLVFLGTRIILAYGIEIMQNRMSTPVSIKAFRTEKGLSQQNLATILNVGQMTVVRWEMGKSEPEGTAAAVLTTLVSDVSQREDLRMYGPVASGYAIYRMLKERLEKKERR